jgi:hypothetical protein
MDDSREMETGQTQDGVQELITRAGSRANAARRAAGRFATEELLPLETWVSYPVPVSRPFGPALTVFVAQADADEQVRDYLVHEPEMQVTVDADELGPLGYEIWREPVEVDIESPVSTLSTARARELLPAHRDALEQELLLLFDTVASVYWFRNIPSQSDQAAVERYDSLWRFLVPKELFPYYRALNKDFFDWFSATANSPGLVQNEIPPAPAEGIVPPPRLFPEPWDAPVVIDMWDSASDPFAVGADAPRQEGTDA